MRSKNSENTGVNVGGRVLIDGTVGEMGEGIGRKWGVVEGVHFVSLILSLLLVSSAPLPTLSILQEKNSSSESFSNSMYILTFPRPSHPMTSFPVTLPTELTLFYRPPYPLS